MRLVEKLLVECPGVEKALAGENPEVGHCSVRRCDQPAAGRVTIKQLAAIVSPDWFLAAIGRNLFGDGRCQQIAK
jgi:hypothetical protein